MKQDDNGEDRSLMEHHSTDEETQKVPWNQPGSTGKNVADKHRSGRQHRIAEVSSQIHLETDGHLL